MRAYALYGIQPITWEYPDCPPATYSAYTVENL